MRFRSPFFVKQAGAAKVGQGYVYDAVLEAANARYIPGDITTEEFREEMLARLKRA
ncbi:antitoxin VbhA family protein [Sinorhizobium medicae]